MRDSIKYKNIISVLCTFAHFCESTYTNILQLCCFVFCLTGAEHRNICRITFVVEVKGAAHRNMNNNKLKMKMKTIPIITALLIFHLLLHSQQNQSIIYPGQTHTNQSPDTLFCLKKQQIETLMEKEAIKAEIISNLQTKNELCDSLVSLKTIEAENWYQKLLENDILLEQETIKFTELKHKSRRRNGLWFGAGVIAGLIIGVL